jgi:hypothetical protein
MDMKARWVYPAKEDDERLIAHVAGVDVYLFEGAPNEYRVFVFEQAIVSHVSAPVSRYTFDATRNWLSVLNDADKDWNIIQRIVSPTEYDLLRAYYALSVGGL